MHIEWYLHLLYYCNAANVILLHTDIGVSSSKPIGPFFGLKYMFKYMYNMYNSHQYCNIARVILQSLHIRYVSLKSDKRAVAISQRPVTGKEYFYWVQYEYIQRTQYKSEKM